jgi:hypothetical protein
VERVIRGKGRDARDKEQGTRGMWKVRIRGKGRVARDKGHVTSKG